MFPSTAIEPNLKSVFFKRESDKHPKWYFVSVFPGLKIKSGRMEMSHIRQSRWHPTLSLSLSALCKQCRVDLRPNSRVLTALTEPSSLLLLLRQKLYHSKSSSMVFTLKLYLDFRSKSLFCWDQTSEEPYIDLRLNKNLSAKCLTQKITVFIAVHSASRRQPCTYLQMSLQRLHFIRRKPACRDWFFLKKKNSLRDDRNLHLNMELQLRLN